MFGWGRVKCDKSEKQNYVCVICLIILSTVGIEFEIDIDASLIFISLCFADMLHKWEARLRSYRKYIVMICKIVFSNWPCLLGEFYSRLVKDKAAYLKAQNLMLTRLLEATDANNNCTALIWSV